MSVIRLDLTTKKLQATMASTHSTSQPECIVCFYDMLAQSDQTIFSAKGASQVASLSDVTDIDICTAPDVNGKVRHVDYIGIHNKDTATQTITVKMDISGVDYVLIKQAVNTGETLLFEGGQSGIGWHII